MRYIIDRIEGDFAVCGDELGNMRNIALSELPAGAGEGSVIDFENGRYVLNSAAEEERRRKIRSLEDKLFK